MSYLYEVNKFYIITTASHCYPVKIGVSDNPGKRLENIQSANWQELGLYLSVSTNNALALELALKRHLSHCKIRGEWFDIEAELVANKVYKMMREIKNGLEDNITIL